MRCTSRRSSPTTTCPSALSNDSTTATHKIPSSRRPPFTCAKTTATKSTKRTKTRWAHSYSKISLFLDYTPTPCQCGRASSRARNSNAACCCFPMEMPLSTQTQSDPDKTKSVWFDIAHIHSFPEWFTFLLEMELLDAYQHQRHLVVSSLSHFSFVEEQFSLQKIGVMLQNILNAYSDKTKSQSAKRPQRKESVLPVEDYSSGEEDLQVGHQEVPYLLQRCLQKFEEDRGIGEVVFEYMWSTEDRYTKESKVLKKLCNMIVRKYKDYEFEFKTNEVAAIENTLVRKKKKQKNKKPKEEEEKGTSQQASPLQVPDGDNLTNKQLLISSKKEEPEGSKSSQVETGNSSKTERQACSETPLKGGSSQKSKAKKGKSPAVQNVKTADQQNLKREILPQKTKQTKDKLTSQRINQFILSFKEQLEQSSLSMDKYRKLCFDTVRDSILSLQLKAEWEIVAYGSSSISFALKDSDLDIALAAQDPDGKVLGAIYGHLRVQEWLRNCTITQIQSAQAQLLQFEVLLGRLCKDKKLTAEVLHVDVSTTNSSAQHEGIRNTNSLRRLFDQNPSLKVVSLVLKELLRLYALNKPFRGGLGSYVLVILVHNILKIKQFPADHDYFGQLLQVCSFMTEEFEPYSTLIAASQNSKTQPNPKLELSLEDPADCGLVNTARVRQIGDIIDLFGALKQRLLQIREDLAQIPQEERKKMKRVFFEHWSIVFRPREPCA